jgi:hypothetical protein
MAFPSVEWEEIRERFTAHYCSATAMNCQVTATRVEVIQVAEFEGLKQAGVMPAAALQLSRNEAKTQKSSLKTATLFLKTL